jgi:multiple sugar transport system permease protein
MKPFKRNIIPSFLRPKNVGESVLTIQIWQFTGTSVLNLFVFLLLTSYLSPLAYMLVTSVKESAQLQDSKAPIYPAINSLYMYEGRPRTVLKVPTKDGMKEWAIITPRRTYAEFIDPQNPEAGLIRWEGNWRALEKAYHFELSFAAFATVLSADRTPTIPQAMASTLWVALLSEVGALVSSVAVAYGFSRFRVPGGKWLFFLLIGTILIPNAVTLVPTYASYVRLLRWLPNEPAAQFFSTNIWPAIVNVMAFLQIPFPRYTPWVWIPLIVPHFFANAVYVFLLRQNFKSIPRDLDEAAMIDGAGPMRILFSIIIPQSIPAIATVALLHFFYSWNEVHMSSLYLVTRPDLWPISTQVMTSAARISTAEGAQAAALLLLIVPVAVLFLFQRFFMNDMVVTGLEK